MYFCPTFVSLFLFLSFPLSHGLGCDDTGIVKTLYEDIGSFSPFKAAINEKGNVTITASSVQLTTTNTGEAGGFWFTSPILFQGDGGFSIKFALRATDGFGNGEGWGFILQTISNQEPVILGPAGWSRTGAFVIEFDTRNSGSANKDTSDNHIGVFLSATERCTVDVNGGFSNGSLWVAWVDYSGYNEKLEVRLNAVGQSRPQDAILSCNVGIWNALNLENNVYAGFTASNPIDGTPGAEHELQEFISIADAYRPWDSEDCGVYDTCTQRSTSSMCVTYEGFNQCSTLPCPPSPFWDIGGTDCCRFVEKQTNKITTPASDFVIGDNVQCEVTRSTILQLAPVNSAECQGLFP